MDRETAFLAKHFPQPTRGKRLPKTALRNVLKSPHSDIRFCVALALINIGSSGCDLAPALIAALDDPNEYTREALVDAIAASGSRDPVVAAALISRLHDPRMRVRLAAVRALAAMQFEEHVVHLLNVMYWRSSQPIKEVVDAIVSYGADALAKVLSELTKKRDSATIENCVHLCQILSTMSSQAAPAIDSLKEALLVPKLKVTLAALETIEAIGPEAASAEQHVTQLISNSDERIKAAACRALAAMGIPTDVALRRIRECSNNPDQVLSRKLFKAIFLSE